MTLNFKFSIISCIVIISILLIMIFLNKYLPIKPLFLILELSLIVLSLIYLGDYLVNPFYIVEVDIYKSGLTTSVFVFIRLIVIVLIATILTISTKPSDLTIAFEWLLKPLKLIKIEPEEIALIITIALRYIPTILDEAYKIMDSQASRGADFRSGSIGKKISQIISLIIPMFVLSFERSDELSDAMIVRNYVPGKTKTRYHVLTWEKRDTLFMIFTTILLGASICLMILF